MLIHKLRMDTNCAIRFDYQLNWLRTQRLLKRKRPTTASAFNRVTENPRDLNLLVGDSETFLQAVSKVGLLAQSKAPVVISGETGSGKELLARAIHYQSVRKDKPF